MYKEKNTTVKSSLNPLDRMSTGKRSVRIGGRAEVESEKLIEDDSETREEDICREEQC